MHRWAFTLATLVLTAGILMAAQDKAPAAPAAQSSASKASSATHDVSELSDVERLQLENAQKDAIIQQQQAQALHMQIQALQAQEPIVNQNYAAALKALDDKAAEIKKHYNWGDDVVFNREFDKDHPVFTQKPVAQPPVPAVPADAKKPKS